MVIRRPVVSGQFYPAAVRDIKRLIASFDIDNQQKKMNALGCILPHAGYIFSGKVACETLSRIKITDTCVILGPNHTGFGPEASIMQEGAWEIPQGNIGIDTELASTIIKNSKYLRQDSLAHNYEHSIEVLLPLISEFAGKEFRFVPIILATTDELVYKDIANALCAAIQKKGKNTIIIASSDMTHYEPRDEASKKDRAAVDAILELDEEKLIEKVKTLNISMCGYIPSAIATLASKKLGAKGATLVSYRTSGDTSGDYDSVVGYAGIIIQ